MPSKRRLDALDTGRLRVAPPRVPRTWLDGARVAEESGAALVPAARFGGDGGRRLGQGAAEDRWLGRQPVPRGRLPRRAWRGRAAFRLHRARRRADAVLRQCRRPCGRGHHGRHLGHRRLAAPRSAATAISPAGPGSAACWNRCRPTPVIIEDDCFIGARSEVARAWWSGRAACCRWASSWRLHQDRRPRHGRDLHRPGAAYSVVVPGNAAGPGAAGWLARAIALLRGDREAGRCADPVQDIHQRTAAGLGRAALLDPVALTQALIRCPSVTPADAGALDVVADALERLGLHGAPADVRRHTEPVCPARQRPARMSASPAIRTSCRRATPPGPPTRSAAHMRDGALIGRGACDMKGAVAAFIAAASAETGAAGSVSLLITGDEEGPATGGTVRVLEWMARHGHIPDFCLVGEPTNPSRLGEVVKIGRRGSLNARITVRGTQGHVAYPARVDNPVHRLVSILGTVLGDGGWTRHRVVRAVQPAGHQCRRRQPGHQRRAGHGHARLNIRFNDRHTGASARRSGCRRRSSQPSRPCASMDVSVSGEAFLTAPGPAHGPAGGRHRGRDRAVSDGRHRRRHVRRAVHRPLLPGRRVRLGRRDHAHGRRERAGWPICMR